MFQALEGKETSTLLGKYIIHGNIKISEEIKCKTAEFARKGMTLYDAQSAIKSYLCQKYTKEWYNKNGGESQFLVEEVYNELERNNMSEKYRQSHSGTFSLLVKRISNILSTR